MCEVDALDGEFPIVIVGCLKHFGLHDFAVFLQNVIVDHISCFLLNLQLVEFLAVQMVEPDEIGEFFG